MSNIDPEIQKNIWELIKSWPGGFITAVILFIIYLWKLEEINKNLLLPIYKFFYNIFGFCKRKYLAVDIESDINCHVKKINKKLIDYKVEGIKIEWVKEGSEECILKNNKAIIRMKKLQDQNVNFVNAVNILVEHSLLVKSKKYLNRNQIKSIELFTIKKICETQKRKHVISYFHDNCYIPEIEKDPLIKEYFEKFDQIDKKGLYISLFLQELLFLGEKIFFTNREEFIIREIDLFINFLNNFSRRKPGEIDVDTNFLGSNINFGIVLIANPEKRDREGMMPYLLYIQSLIEKNVEDIYLLARGSNVKFLRDMKNHITSISKKLDFRNEDVITLKTFDSNGRVSKIKLATILFKNKEVENSGGGNYEDRINDLE